MPVIFEGKEYQAAKTRPDIPYTLYIADDHLLVVPRAISKNHKEFPRVAENEQRRFILKLCERNTNEYKDQYKKDPKFDSKHVSFGLEEDEGVAVCALLPGSNMIPYWPFRDMLAGDQTVITKHFCDLASHPREGYGLMEWGLAQAA